MKPVFRWLLALCLTAPVLAHAQASEEEEAGDVSEVDKDRLGPLRERVRPVSGHVFLKKGRFEFSPSATVSLRDAFFTKYIFGGTLTYHPMETLGVSLRLGYALTSVAGAAQICTFSDGTDGSTRGCSSPTMKDLDGQAPGQLKLMGGVDLQWAPIYGKLSLLAEKFVHFDLYGVVGASVVQYRGPDLDDTTGLLAKDYLTPGGNVGVGLRFFFNRWVSLRTEVRDLIYVEKSRTSDSYLRNQLMFELGVSFFFPSSNPES
ncbi:outer membrane beta-barrel domain-containing protein [Myxococcus faecalis]|jgi:outer membrane beta-barrel protein|uniref:outer membrane beta-barrel domain-containing protein n=1 Tax=Myxococcus TaxID=32 RepID=UPI001CBE9F23|nr:MULTISPECIES: outer membrane beta-barrel domain-containing protein [unclassified Myxococcus]MBZ4396952.1 outer membrane beta-barrel domain-containing protein [Myxococcus sp. AS-1-15]MBZ4408322.1 outer membrane beta-barrel domain-containing protein [Myxococcus sp. XM-1-1-1]BDT33420.1 outer membrane beta-barrel domain-containing protein [Myxococcus sp. MH1]